MRETATDNERDTGSQRESKGVIETARTNVRDSERDTERDSKRQ